MVAVGFLAGLAVAVRYAAKEGIGAETILDLFIYVVISAIVGARLFYVIGFPQSFIQDPLSIFRVNEGGMVFFGGLLFSLMSVIVFVHKRKIDVWKMLDAIAPACALGYGIGRIGCFLNGCCYGIELFGIVQPTQIYSSVAGFIMFAVLTWLYRGKKFDGQIALMGLVLYCAYRFFLEFLRYSPVHVWIFTLNQILAVLIFIAASYFLWKKSAT